MDGQGPKAQGPQQEGHPARALARARKDDGCRPAQLRQHVRQVGVLVAGRDEQVLLAQGGDRGVPVAGAGLHADGVAQGGALQFGDLGRHRRRVQLRRPPLARRGFQDGVDLCLEVQVEQPVRLVQDQVFQAPQGEAFRVGQVVDDPPRRADHDVRAAAQGERLGDHVHAADEGHAPGAQAGAQGFHLFPDLDGQLPGGGQDEGVEGLRGVHEALREEKRKRKRRKKRKKNRG